MASYKEQQRLNMESVARQKLRRGAREAEKDIDKREKALLSGAKTREQREDIRDRADAARDAISSSLKKKQGQVYDIALTYEPSDNKEEISTATNDTFGNDFFEFEDDGSGGGGGLPDGYEETEVILCQNGSPVDGFILFKLA